ncbi:MAG: hypothetical protein WBW00_12800 [Pseudolabrys sp.]|jgi:hypothetical protein
MRMPVLRYFVVVGAVLLGLLYWAGDQGTSNSPALKTAQTVGIPKSFKPQLQLQLQLQPLSEVTAVNFASEYDHPQTSAAKTVETKPVKQAETKRKDKAASRHQPTWNRFVEYPHDNLSIH